MRRILAFMSLSRGSRYSSAATLILPWCLVLCCASSSGYPAQQAANPAKPTQKPSPEEVEQANQRAYFVGLIEASVSQASGFEAGTQAWLLLSAAGAIQSTDPSEARSYLLSAYEAAEKVSLLDTDDLRANIQGNVVEKLSNSDPDKAFELLEGMDKPNWTINPHEDFRNWIASDIAAAFLARNAAGDRDKAREVFRFTGDTGQYPYKGATTMRRCARTWRSAADGWRCRIPKRLRIPMGRRSVLGAAFTTRK